MPDGLPTLRTSYVRVLVWCKACRHQANADLEAMISTGRGDVPLVQFRCTNCRSRLTDFVVTGGSTCGRGDRDRRLLPTRGGGACRRHGRTLAPPVTEVGEPRAAARTPEL